LSFRIEIRLKKKGARSVNPPEERD
jgi:hypothetical protein